MKSILLSVLTSCFILSVLAKDDTLFTIGDEAVKLSEFEYIYNKNNFSGANKYSKKSIEDYLELYINFRLKVKEANDLGYANNPKFKEEFATYENQLMNSYIDKEVLDKVLLQEYERSKTDVEVSHIFFAVNNIVSDEQAKKKAIDLYKKIIENKISFEAATAQSEDSKTNTKNGYLGWYNSNQIVLPEFEEWAYKLDKGEVSLPAKTKYGYHLIKLNNTRVARPKLKVAIIKKNIPFEATAEVVKSIQDTINLIVDAYKKGTPFEELVHTYSDDEGSKQFDGKLDWFGINTFTPAFEEAAYAIKKVGDISEPVQTKSAIYIIKKLDETKPQSFEEAKPILRSKLTNSSLYDQAFLNFINKQKALHNFIAYNSNITAFKKYLQKFVGNFAFKYKDTTPNLILYKLDNQDFDQNIVGHAIQKIYYTFTPKNNLEPRIDAVYNEVEKQNVLNLYKQEIRSKNLEYQQLIDEYKNGIMIFDISEEKVWNKASEDTAGLRAYYQAHQSDFTKNASVQERNISISDSKIAKSIYKELLKNPSISTSALKDKLLVLGEKSATITEKTIELPQNEHTSSISKPSKTTSSYIIHQYYNFTPKTIKDFNEVKGYVIAAYQEELEKEWIESLKKKYLVTVNNSVLQTIIKH